MNFFAHFCIYFLVYSKYGAASGQRKKVLVMAFGLREKLTVDYGQTLKLFEIAHNTAVNLMNSNEKYEIKMAPIEDNCSPEMNWIDSAYKKLNFDLISFFQNGAGKPTSNVDYVLHVGPMCEYKEEIFTEYAEYEMTDYVANLLKYYADVYVADVQHFFASPSMFVSVNENSDPILEGKRAIAQKFNQTESARFDSYLPLTITLKRFAQLLLDFTVDQISAHATILINVRKNQGHVNVFCNRLLKAAKNLSDHTDHMLARYSYVDVNTEDGYVNLWKHFMYRTRYVLFCGDGDYFVGWLQSFEKIGKYKRDQFGIFYVTYGIDEKNDVIKPDINESVTDLFKDAKFPLDNVKLLTLTNSFECQEKGGFRNFCRNLEKNMPDFEGTKFMVHQYKAQIYFYNLALFKFFRSVYRKFDIFWQTAKKLQDVRNITKPSVELRAFDLTKKDEKIGLNLVCTLVENFPIGKSSCRFHWGGKREPYRAPTACGFKECDASPFKEWSALLASGVSVVGLSLIAMAIIFFLYLRHKKKAVTVMPTLGQVRIKVEEITPEENSCAETSLSCDKTPNSAHLPKGQFGVNPKQLPLNSQKLTSTQVSCDKILKPTGSPKGYGRVSPKGHVGVKPRQLVMNAENFRPVPGNYCNTSVMVYPFIIGKHKEQTFRAFVAELRNICLENVARIHGYIGQPTPNLFGLVVESGDHGTLFTLLQVDDLDLALKLPLLIDLCRALANIHGSVVRHHGNLSSHCCVVDAHFVLKVQLTEFSDLKNLAPKGTVDKEICDGEKLWSAPEVLRNEPNISLRLVDIYSFGIIAQEIVYQRGPFFIKEKTLRNLHKPKDGPYPCKPEDKASLIVKILKDKNRHIMPTLMMGPAEEAVMLILQEMIRNCWEPPLQRWSLKKIDEAIKRTMKDLHIVTAFGSLVERLQFYTHHLQEALQQKADHFEEERRRIRDVIDRMFTIEIAQDLLEGKRPVPRHFDNVCVYYNDLVNFTFMAAQNKPEVIVEFLNTLFLKYDDIIERYDIHPITRIGDAYMLVSGIPVDSTEGARNASEIAQAALQIVSSVKKMRFDHLIGFKEVSIRTGVASGSVVLSVVGVEIPSLCVCGEVVVAAAKMESQSGPMKILVAQSAYDFLKSDFQFERASHVIVEGAAVECWWLVAMKGRAMVENKRLDGKPWSIKASIKSAKSHKTI